MKFEDACGVLGVDPNTVTVKSAQKSFRALAKLHHPDANGSVGAEEFKRISQAYQEILHNLRNPNTAGSDSVKIASVHPGRIDFCEIPWDSAKIGNVTVSINGISSDNKIYVDWSGRFEGNRYLENNPIPDWASELEIIDHSSAQHVMFSIQFSVDAKHLGTGSYQDQILIMATSANGKVLDGRRVSVNFVILRPEIRIKDYGTSLKLRSEEGQTRRYLFTVVDAASASLDISTEVTCQWIPNKPTWASDINMEGDEIAWILGGGFPFDMSFTVNSDSAGTNKGEIGICIDGILIQTFAVSLEVKAPPKPVLEIDPDQLDFGTLKYDETKRLELVITNSGGALRKPLEFGFEGPRYNCFRVLPSASGGKNTFPKSITVEVRKLYSTKDLMGNTLWISADTEKYSVSILGKVHTLEEEEQEERNRKSSVNVLLSIMALVLIFFCVRAVAAVNWELIWLNIKEAAKIIGGILLVVLCIYGVLHRG